MMEHDIIIGEDGTVQFIYADALAGAFDATGDMTTSRASHVEPAHGGRLWQADLGPVGGPVLGPFMRRADALAAEAEWLLREMAQRHLQARP